MDVEQRRVEFARTELKAMGPLKKAEKIVLSRTLTGAKTRNTRVERNFDVEPVAS